MRRCSTLLLLIAMLGSVENLNDWALDDKQLISQLLSYDHGVVDRQKRNSFGRLPAKPDETGKDNSWLTDDEDNSKSEDLDTEKRDTFGRPYVRAIDPDNLEEYALDSGKDYMPGEGSNLEAGAFSSQGSQGRGALGVDTQEELGRSRYPLDQNDAFDEKDLYEPTKMDSSLGAQEVGNPGYEEKIGATYGSRGSGQTGDRNPGYFKTGKFGGEMEGGQEEFGSQKPQNSLSYRERGATGGSTEVRNQQGFGMNNQEDTIDEQGPKLAGYGDENTGYQIPERTGYSSRLQHPPSESNSPLKEEYLDKTPERVSASLRPGSATSGGSMQGAPEQEVSEKKPMSFHEGFESQQGKLLEDESKKIGESQNPSRLWPTRKQQKPQPQSPETLGRPNKMRGNGHIGHGGGQPKTQNKEKPMEGEPTTVVEDVYSQDPNGADETVVEVVFDCTTCGDACPESCNAAMNNTVMMIENYCCANSILTVPGLCPSCPHIDTSNCPTSGEEYDRYNEMYYIVEIGLKDSYIKEFADPNSDEFKKLRQKCQAFLIRVYADHPYYQETIIKSVRNSKDYSIVSMMIRFTKESFGNIKLFYKALMCKCGCEIFYMDLFFKLSPANTTDLYDFCPAYCFQQQRTECDNDRACRGGCCDGLPPGSYFLKQLPGQLMPGLLPSILGGGMNSFPDIMCPGNCPPTCAPMCSADCCLGVMPFKRTVAEHSNSRHRLNS